MTGQNRGNYTLLIFTLMLLAVNIFLLRLDIKGSYKGLTFAMLDVGQGDALFIESPTGTQILVDAGPPRKVLKELSQVMSPFDRKIDAIIMTNPDQDHIGGFQDVLKAYEVDKVIEPGTVNDSQTFKNLKATIKNKNIFKTFLI